MPTHVPSTRALPFVYLASDTATKTPVVLKDQARGTHLILVTPMGDEHAVMAGNFHLKAESTPDLIKHKAKLKSYDHRDAKFPNLKISRD